MILFDDKIWFSGFNSVSKPCLCFIEYDLVLMKKKKMFFKIDLGIQILTVFHLGENNNFFR